MKINYLTIIMAMSMSATAQENEFVDVHSLDKDIVLDIKYATPDNFLKQAVYDCGRCYLRQATADALVRANQDFKKLGYRIKVFDCYRPLSVQKKMWQILPNPTYVANPTKGSRHNRGAAVDLTLVDSQGQELDMGTEFDYFGKKSHHDYQNLSKTVLANRKLLKDVLAKHEFSKLNSEWWHYDHRPQMTALVSDFVWQCK